MSARVAMTVAIVVTLLMAAGGSVAQRQQHRTRCALHVVSEPGCPR